jgi:hypothetical protein
MVLWACFSSRAVAKATLMPEMLAAAELGELWGVESVPPPADDDQDMGGGGGDWEDERGEEIENGTGNNG